MFHACVQRFDGMNGNFLDGELTLVSLCHLYYTPKARQGALSHRSLFMNSFPS